MGPDVGILIYGEGGDALKYSGWSFLSGQNSMQGGQNTTQR